jgi:acyl carrier protein
MMTTDLESIILDFIRDELGNGQPIDLDAGANLLTSGLVDSVGIMRLVAHVESQLHLTVPATDLVPGNFRTVEIMAAYLQRLLEH